MKKFIFPVLVSFAVLSCGANDTVGPPSGQNNNDITHAFLPPASIFYELPSSISHANSSPAVAASLFKTSAEEVTPTVDSAEVDLPVTHYSSDDVDLTDAYLPVTEYIYHAEKAKKAIADFVRKISTWEIPENGETNFENWVITTRSSDSLFDALSVRFHSVIISQNSQVVLYLNYFRNARGEYRGNFFYNSIENPGAIVLVRYNGFNADVLGQRTAVIYHNPVENVQGNDPSVVRIRTVKRDGLVSVRGFSYHPLFEDAFFGVGPHVYAFNAVASLDRDNAVLRVAFVPTSSQSLDVFQEYSLDRVTLRRGFNMFRDTLLNNELFARAFLWSIETEQAIDESRYAEIALYTPEGTIDDVDADDLIDFLELNPALVANDPNLQHFYEFVNTRQAIVLSANGTFVGAYGALLPDELEELGVDEDFLEDYFPSVSDLVEEINELLLEDEDDDLTEGVQGVVEEIDELFEEVDEELIEEIIGA